MKKIRIFLRIRSKNFVLEARDWIEIYVTIYREIRSMIWKNEGLMRNEIINSSETEFHDDASSIDRC